MLHSEISTCPDSGRRMRKANRIFGFFSILCVCAVIFCFVFRHGSFIFLTALFFICWVVSLGIKKNEAKVFIPFYAYLLGVIIAFGMAWIMLIIPIMEMTFCRHSRWEYALEIDYYKSKDYKLSYFPETLPKGARNVEWIVIPAFWQAKGNLVLGFDAGEEYIQQYIREHNAQVIDLYAEFDKEYSDEEYRRFCEALDMDAFKMISNRLLPPYVELSLEEMKSAVEYRLDENGGRGFIVVEESNRIIFFRDYESY